MRSPSPVPEREQPNSTRYRLLYKIATGGAGTVYLGERIGAAGFSRLVAIKRANPELFGDPEAKKMLVQEAAIASRIHHAHVIPVQDVELSGEDLLLVMDYVPGATLSRLLEEGGLPPRLAMRVALDMVSGVRAVHELCDDDGIPYAALHRDISPDNVLIGFDGSVRITDFGLARAAQTSYVSATGLLSGKLAYLAPEILEGGSFSSQSDQFSLAVVVHETLTGKRLFAGGDEKEVSGRVRTLVAPPVSRLVPELPGELDDILGRALSKSNRDRFPSVAEMGSRLEELARRHSLIATDTELADHLRRVLGEDPRRALARGRVSAAGERPAVDFTFAETPSISLGGQVMLEDAPTALRAARRALTPTAPWTQAPAPSESVPVPVPDSGAPSPVKAARVSGRTALALVAVLLVAAIAVVRWQSTVPEPAAIEPAAPTQDPPPAAPPVPPPVEPAAPAPQPAAIRLDPQAIDAKADASKPLPSRAAASAKPAPADSTALPANPYRKKL